MRRNVVFRNSGQNILTVAFTDVNQHVCIRKHFGESVLTRYLTTCRGVTTKVVLVDFVHGSRCNAIVIEFEPLFTGVGPQKGTVMASVDVTDVNKNAIQKLT